MPVSKKRRKDGKPVQRRAATDENQSASDHPEDTRPIHPQMKAGKPKNPFVAHQPQLRGSQRGR
jgi:hypothetical protein